MKGRREMGKHTIHLVTRSSLLLAALNLSPLIAILLSFHMCLDKSVGSVLFDLRLPRGVEIASRIRERKVLHSSPHLIKLDAHTKRYKGWDQQTPSAYK